MGTAIKWIFLDVGNVLVCDDRAMAMVYRMIYRDVMREDPGVTFAELMAERERLIIMERSSRPWEALAVSRLGKDGWKEIHTEFLKRQERDYLRLHQPIPGVTPILKELSRDYGLAVAANQAKACRGAFEKLKWMEYFSEFWISEEVRLRKPEKQFFTGLLEKIGCEPGGVVMIGDRLDADIEPAKELGMRAVLARWAFDVWDGGETEWERAFHDSLKRARVGDVATNRKPKPDVVVDRIEELPTVIGRL